MMLDEAKRGMLVLVLGEIGPHGDGELTPNNAGAVGIVETFLVGSDYPIVIRRLDAKAWAEDDGTSNGSMSRSFRPDEIVPLDPAIAILYGVDQA